MNKDQQQTPKRVPYTINVKAVLPCQRDVRHEIMVEQERMEGVPVLTLHSLRLIENIQMQSQIKLLIEAVRILHETINHR